eukprot:scaffold26622_cov22-Tisochrysis_lutea.AAC.5
MAHRVLKLLSNATLGKKVSSSGSDIGHNCKYDHALLILYTHTRTPLHALHKQYDSDYALHRRYDHPLLRHQRKRHVQATHCTLCSVSISKTVPCTGTGAPSLPRV